MIKLAIFDLDGTLINSIEDLADSTNFALEQFGFPTHSLDKFNFFIGDGMRKLIERALPEDKRSCQLITSVLDVFLEHYRKHFLDKTYIYDGILKVLGTLKESGIMLAVVSNKAQEMADKIAEELFSGIFDIFYGKQDDFPAKPDAALTLKAIGELGAKPSECVFIGDSGMDAATAVNAGAIGIGVLWGYRGKEELLSNGAKYIAEVPDDILEITKAINNEI